MAEPAETAGEGAIDASTAHHLLEVMWRIRALERCLALLDRSGGLPRPVPSSAGHEAVAAGVCGQLASHEPVFGSHRPVGQALAKGIELGPLLAELLGRADGCCGGLGGGHLVDLACGFLGVTGPSGDQLPVAVGTALADRLVGRVRPVVAIFGETAARSGLFAESVALAARWRLPVVLVCENDTFAEPLLGGRPHRSVRVAELVTPHELAAATVDGGDLAEVHQAFGVALRAARGGGGPFLLECLTHRLDPDVSNLAQGSGRPAEDGAAREDQPAGDPLARLLRQAMAAGWFEAPDAEAARTGAEAEVEAALAFAEASPRPTAAKTPRRLGPAGPW